MVCLSKKVNHKSSKYIDHVIVYLLGHVGVFLFFFRFKKRPPICQYFGSTTIVQTRMFLPDKGTMSFAEQKECIHWSASSLFWRFLIFCFISIMVKTISTLNLDLFYNEENITCTKKDTDKDFLLHPLGYLKFQVKEYVCIQAQQLLPKKEKTFILLKTDSPLKCLNLPV